MTGEHEIMAAYDGSAGSAEALDWAVREARLRGLPLTVCHAWAPGYAAAGAREAHPALPVEQAGVVDPAREYAEAVLTEGVRHAQTRDSAVASRPLLVCGPAARVLCEQCTSSDMLVVGSRGNGGLAGLLLGSVSLQVATHAPAPVTVVRGSWRPVPGQYPPPVVVGTDGSPGSQAAVDVAVEEAALRDVPLVAVCALSDAAGVFGTARAIEADFITAMGKLQADHPEVLVQKRVAQGAPRSALLAAASQGQLLVVGARGRGGLREMMLGSVSLAILHHATCPVTVVHGG
jgi:nucleotide-binding universal stress UspA family protein